MDVIVDLCTFFVGSYKFPIFVGTGPQPDGALLNIDCRKEEITMGFFKKFFSKTPEGLFAPMAGKAVPVTEVPDPTFAEGMLGNGIAIVPTDGKVYAPCDASVDMMFPTGHAVSLVAKNGAEILIHIGLETVGLEGKPFKVHINSGDEVKKGQLMIEADLDAIQAAGLPITTPVLVCNPDAFSTFKTVTGKDVTGEDLVIELAK